MNFELTASMMCADYGHLEQEVKNLAESGIDSFHIDIMDGRYVPNFAMSLNDILFYLQVLKIRLHRRSFAQAPKYFPATVCRGECAGNVPGRMLLFSLLRWELFSSIIEPSFTQLKFGTGNRHDLQENP